MGEDEGKGGEGGGGVGVNGGKWGENGRKYCVGVKMRERGGIGGKWGGRGGRGGGGEMGGKRGGGGNGGEEGGEEGGGRGGKWGEEGGMGGNGGKRGGVGRWGGDGGSQDLPLPLGVPPPPAPAMPHTKPFPRRRSSGGRASPGRPLVSRTPPGRARVSRAHPNAFVFCSVVGEKYVKRTPAFRNSSRNSGVQCRGWCRRATRPRKIWCPCSSEKRLSRVMWRWTSSCPGPVLVLVLPALRLRVEVGLLRLLLLGPGCVSVPLPCRGARRVWHDARACGGAAGGADRAIATQSPTVGDYRLTFVG